MAAGSGQIDILEFLRDKGVSFNVKDRHGDSALYWAARQGHSNVVMYLHQNGVPLDEINKVNTNNCANAGFASRICYSCQIGYHSLSLVTA